MLLAVLLALLTACGAAPHPPAATPQAPTTSATPAFIPTDTAWLQLMISMDANLADLLDLAPTRAADPRLRAAAATLRADLAAHLAALTDLRTRAALPDTDPHAGHAMPGMVTDADLVAMARATGPAFDRDLVRLTTAHLDQSTLLADGVRASGENPAVRALAEEIARHAPARRGELERATA